MRAFVQSHFAIIAAALKPTTRRSHRSIIEQRLLPVFGGTQLDAITSIAVVDLKVVLRTQGYAPAYVNDCVRVLKVLLHQAVERDVIPTYPLRKKVPRGGE